MSSALPRRRLEISKFNTKSVLPNGGVEMWALPGRHGLTKDVTELHYGYVGYSV